MHYVETFAHPRYDDYDIAYTSKNRFAYLGNGLSEIKLNPKADPVYYIREKEGVRMAGTFNARQIRGRTFQTKLL